MRHKLELHDPGEPGKAKVVLDGHEIQDYVQSVVVDCGAGRQPTITVNVLADAVVAVENAELRASLTPKVLAALLMQYRAQHRNDCEVRVLTGKCTCGLDNLMFFGGLDK